MDDVEQVQYHISRRFPDTNMVIEQDTAKEGFTFLVVKTTELSIEDLQDAMRGVNGWKAAIFTNYKGGGEVLGALPQDKRL